MVNRLWLHHFGEGIVSTPENFGRTGAPPTHPELLDWLATEFVARGWSLKAMHRLIVTSAAYRQSCRDDPGARAGAKRSIRTTACCGGSGCGGWRPRRCATRC